MEQMLRRFTIDENRNPRCGLLASAYCSEEGRVEQHLDLLYPESDIIQAFAHTAGEKFRKTTQSVAVVFVAYDTPAGVNVSGGLREGLRAASFADYRVVPGEPPKVSQALSPQVYEPGTILPYVDQVVAGLSGRPFQQQ
jgi:hypothetical protein